MHMQFYACMAAVLLALSGRFSESLAYNHPELKWKTLETEHFAIHYYDKTEPLVAQSAVIAEEVYARLVELYGKYESGKIDIVLADYDDMSNGFTDWLGGGVEIWAPDMNFPFRSSTTWLRNVITHELTHIVTLRKTSGFQMLDMSTAVGVTRPGFTMQIGKTFPMMKLFPMWFAEGMAQTGSFRCGNDSWDSRRDMILRCAVLDKKELTLSEMGVFSHDLLGNEQVYNQGFSLAMYIENIAGSEEIQRILKNAAGSSIDPIAAFSSPPGSMIGGHDLDYYYRDWRDSVLNSARKVVPAQLTATECVFQRGRLNQRPLISPDGCRWGWITSNNDDSYRTDLVIAKAGSVDPLLVLKHAESSWDFSPDGDYVYFVKSYDPGEHGSYFKELFRCCLKTGSVEQITHNGRIYAVAASPSGDELAVIRFRNGRFTLEVLNLRTLLFDVVGEGTAGNPYIAVDFNPVDRSKMVVEQLVKGFSSLFLFDRTAKTETRISSGTAREESPCWAEDGRIYFSADYDGIFNIYSMKPDGSDLVRHTSVVGGAFEPMIGKGGKRLLFSEYTSSGFRISTADLTGFPYTIVPRPQFSFSPLPSNGVPPVEGEPYHLRMLRATWESSLIFNSVADDSSSVFSADIGCIRYQNDALQRFFFTTGLEITAGIGQSSDTGAFSGRSLGPFFSSALFQVDRFSRRLDSVAQMPQTRCERLKRQLLQPYNNERPLRTRTLNASTDSTGTTTVLEMAPLCGIALNTLAPSIQSVLGMYLIDFIPFLLTSQSQLTWQTSRSTYVGASCLADVVLLKLILPSGGTNSLGYSADSLKYASAGAAFPLWFIWQDNGYYNKDIEHNLNDIWEALVEFTPSFMPGGVESQGNFDYSRVSRGISGQASFFRGFPLTKYSGIPFEVDAGCSWYEFPVNRTLIDTFGIAGNSDLYLRTEAAVAYCFPVFRNINHGRRLFWDGLYGRVGYRLSATANHFFMVQLEKSGDRWGSVLKRNLFTSAPDSGIAVSNTLFATVEINSVSEFMFSGGIQFTLAYDPIKKNSGVYITAEF